MGKRSRKRIGTAADADVVRAAARPEAVSRARTPGRPSRRARMDEAPKAPWSPFPLIELAVLLGLIILVIGILSSGDRRVAMVTAGVVLIMLAGLELSIREHFTGYRSHSTLLAAACALGVIVPGSILVRPPRDLLLIGALAVFGIAFWLLRGAFARRAGGLGFRV